MDGNGTERCRTVAPGEGPMEVHRTCTELQPVRRTGERHTGRLDEATECRATGRRRPHGRGTNVARRRRRGPRDYRYAGRTDRDPKASGGRQRGLREVRLEGLQHPLAE